MNITAKQIWTKLANKEYRDSFVASNISNTVAAQIYTLREGRGWTQKELAKRAGMNQSRIPALEDPNLENFEIGTLKRIASAFDVALVVRFVPFSELTEWTASLSEEKLAVPEFAHDSLSARPANASSIQIVEINVAPYLRSGGMSGMNTNISGFRMGSTCTASVSAGSVIITGSQGIASQSISTNESTRTTLHSQQGNYALG